MLPCLRRICKRSDRPKIERLVNNVARLKLRESLTGQWHDRVQTESQIATVDSCFDLVGSLQHGVASCEVFSWSTDVHTLTICRWWWPQIKLKSKSLPIGQCHMQNAWQGTIGKIQNIVWLPRYGNRSFLIAVAIWLSVWTLSCRCPVKLSTYQPCIIVY